MLQYIAKRLLLMVPTFLFITLIVFVVVNLAPGNPGRSQNASGSEQADQSANAREGYRLFKEQYFLDKPILLNTRFLLERDEVQVVLETIARNSSGAIPGEAQALHVGRTASTVLASLVNREAIALQNQLASGKLPADAQADAERKLQNLGFTRVDPLRPARPAQGIVFDAEELVENWGSDIVPFLLQLATGYVHISPAGAELPWSSGRGVLASELGIRPEEATSGKTVRFEGSEWVVGGVMTAKVRFLAVQRLGVNARRRVVVRDGERADEATLALNREIMSENNRIAQWVYPLDAAETERQAVVAKWTAWYAETAPRFEKDAGDKVRMLLFETRFAKYFSNLAQLDLGTSIRFRRPVFDVIADHWRYSVLLSVISLLLAYIISVPLGIIAAVRQNQFADRGIGIFLFVLYSLPSFFVATLLQTYLTKAAGVDIFPVSGYRSASPLEVTTLGAMWDVTWHLFLPVICLTYGTLAVLSRYARTGLLDVIRSDYIRTARAKGLSEWVVILKHAVRNGMIPILTLLGTTLPVLIGGSIIIEYIFVIDGMGKLMITAIQFRDYNIIMGILLISSVLTLIGILLSDISYALVDPRISFD